MRRGTTPTHTFQTDISLEGAEVIYLTYEQDDRTVLELDQSRMTVTQEQVSVKLEQEETLALDPARRVKMQIRARFADGSAPACNIIEARVEDILKEGVI